MHGNDKLVKETAKVLVFPAMSEERDRSKAFAVQMNNFPKAEDYLQLNILRYDYDFVDGELFGELARRSIQKHDKSVKISCYNNQVCYVSNMNAVFKTLQCGTCDTNFSKKLAIQ